MITLENAQSISDEVKSKGLGYDTVAALRQSYPDIHFTYCMDDDISNGKPVLQSEAFNVYLIDGREHCLCLTNDFDVATGVVLAEVIEEDE
ncbi:MAG: DUF6129 family protein [Gammaproteobacteria bacterium]|jgi:hypothetical protein